MELTHSINIIVKPIISEENELEGFVIENRL